MNSFCASWFALLFWRMAYGLKVRHKSLVVCTNFVGLNFDGEPDWHLLHQTPANSHFAQRGLWNWLRVRNNLLGCYSSSDISNSKCQSNFKLSRQTYFFPKWLKTNFQLLVTRLTFKVTSLYILYISGMTSRWLVWEITAIYFILVERRHF